MKKKFNLNTRNYKFIFVGVLWLLVASVPLFQVIVGGIGYWLHFLMLVLMYIGMASSWNIIGGYTGYTSLGHNIFFGIGAYIAGMLLTYFGLSPFIGAVAAGIMASFIGLIIGFLTLRTRGTTFVIATVALVLIFKISFDNWSFVGGTTGLFLPLPPFPPSISTIPFYYAMLVIATGAVYLSYRVKNSKFGLGLRAIADDEVKAESSGIPINQYKIVAFALSAFFVGAAGAIWGYNTSYLRPVAVFSILISSRMVIMSILGGRGTIVGPILGAVVFKGVEEFFLSAFGGTALNLAFTGFIFLIVLLFFPEGIVGTLDSHDRLPAIFDW